MKNLYFFFLFAPFFSSGQDNIFISNKTPWLFEHLEKVLYLESCTVPLSELSIHSNQTGEIELQPNGSFKVKPRSGKLSIKIFQHQRQDSTLLKTFQFNVKSLPQPIASLRRSTKTVLSKKEFLAQAGLVVELINYDYNINFPIEQFTLLVVKNQTLVYLQTHQGNRFTATMKQALETILQGGEQIFITNIVFKSPYHYHHTANSIAFTIQPN